MGTLLVAGCSKLDGGVASVSIPSGASDGGRVPGSGSDGGLGSSAGRDAGTSSDGGAIASNVPVIGGCAILPPTSAWNTDISNYPLSANSDAYIQSMGATVGMHPDFGTVWNGAPNGIPFVVVDPRQAYLPVTFNLYPSQSDPGPYPVPLDAPIEGGSSSTGDRHVLAVDPATCTLYEMFAAYPGTSGWTAGSGSIWNLGQNQQRPDGWTSADAAGLPILPGLVRYDEVASGQINHALRFTAALVQHAYIYPAVHSDGRTSDPAYPPMGARLRLKASFDIAGFSPQVQVILTAMKKYGLMLADTGGAWYLSGAPDSRWDDNMLLSELGRVQGQNFEVVDTGPVHAY